MPILKVAKNKVGDSHEGDSRPKRSDPSGAAFCHAAHVICDDCFGDTDDGSDYGYFAGQISNPSDRSGQ